MSVISVTSTSMILGRYEIPFPQPLKVTTYPLKEGSVPFDIFRAFAEKIGLEQGAYDQKVRSASGNITYYKNNQIITLLVNEELGSDISSWTYADGASGAKKTIVTLAQAKETLPAYVKALELRVLEMDKNSTGALKKLHGALSAQITGKIEGIEAVLVEKRRTGRRISSPAAVETVRLYATSNFHFHNIL